MHVAPTPHRNSEITESALGSEEARKCRTCKPKLLTLNFLVS